MRPAVRADAPDILRITKEAFEKYAFDLGLRNNVKALQDTLLDVERDIETKHVFIATLAGETVGTIRYSDLAGTAYISRFGVVLKAQSCGVGGALVRTVKELAKADGYSVVSLHTCAKMSSLIRFYYGQGFYIRTTNTDRGYVRALLLHELDPYVDPDMDITALQP